MTKRNSGGQTNLKSSILRALKENAREERIVTYGQLAEQVGLPQQSGRLVVQPLKRILKACQHHGLPWLTAIVVNQKTGRPGKGFTDESGAPIDDKRWSKMVQEVHACDWSKVDVLGD